MDIWMDTKNKHNLVYGLNNANLVEM